MQQDDDLKRVNKTVYECKNDLWSKAIKKNPTTALTNVFTNHNYINYFKLV